MKKHYVTYLFAAAALWAAGCKQENFKPMEGKAMGLKNGINWEAKARINKITDTTFDIYFETYAKNGYKLNGLSIFRIKQWVGFKPLNLKMFDTSVYLNTNYLPYSCGFSTIIDGDVSGDGFILLSPETRNWIKITEYNTEKKIVKGEFEAHFARDTRWNKADFSEPDTIHFERGSFKINL